MRRVWRSIGSLARHSSTCSFGTYFMSSCAAWPCMRMVTASSSVGPSPASARSRALRVASNIASGSLPSTVWPGNPYAAARSTGLTANCWSTGVEYAYWLFSSTKITGSFCTPAQFMASWKSPRDVEPSPNQVIATRCSPRILNAIARPVATSIMSGSIETMPTQPTVRSPKCTLPSRPPVIPPSRPMYCAKIRAGATPRITCAARSRCRMQRRSSAAIAHVAPAETASWP